MDGRQIWVKCSRNVSKYLIPLPEHTSNSTVYIMYNTHNQPHSTWQLETDKWHATTGLLFTASAQAISNAKYMKLQPLDQWFYFLWELTVCRMPWTPWLLRERTHVPYRGHAHVHSWVYGNTLVSTVHLQQVREV